MGRTVGQALDIAISGIKGTVLAAAMGWMLYTISPSGYTSRETSDPLVFWLGLGLGVIYVSHLSRQNLVIGLIAFAGIASFPQASVCLLDGFSLRCAW